tara:strand:+ start:99 stop:266 length:168 start_codon:yes stop_codon:yes gene_type:complete
MSGDPSLKEPVIFYSEELTNTKIVLLSLKGIKLDYVEDEKELNDYELPFIENYSS